MAVGDSQESRSPNADNAAGTTESTEVTELGQEVSERFSKVCCSLMRRRNEGTSYHFCRSVTSVLSVVNHPD